ncbi:ABC transporter ATP-binding protein [Arthrobacter oryzae]|uniref:ABC transporter ATP-binding protein n=1 Tax=Arthrobacter oryzae TaxID=409290 RepID=UPI00273CB280|nr:ABC transporter ATP-binding protein [Arthrobacter oryzae]WLQ05617.1 ATP-binding cassette domain-containing protein [Arthrobacter oryzae]
MRIATVLEARIAAFTYHGEDTAALHDVDVAAAPGTLTAVLGGSGSGKSTLGRLLAGWSFGGHTGRFTGSLHLPAASDGAPPENSAPLVFRGAPDDPRINPALWSEHVGFVPQDAASLLSTVASTVAEELAFGLENRGMERHLMRTEVAHAAGAAGLTALLERDPATLSGGELRRLAVACSAITRPGVLVLDEPLGSLDDAGAASVRALVDRLLDSGTAVIVLSQAADDLAFSATRWLVLDGGTVTARGTPAELAGSPVLLRTGVVLPARTGGGPGLQRRAGVAAAETVLELERISFGYPAGRRRTGPAVFGDLSLTVRAGEVVAVTGPNGAGKSTLLRHFNGLLRPDRGSVRIHGADIAGVPTGRIAERVGLLFQHPRDQLFERTVLREVLFGLDRRFVTDPAVRARAALDAVGLGDRLDTHPQELPASLQRLLALATVLAREPRLIALDEPTVGLDRHGLELLDDAMGAAAERGAAVVMVTHDLTYARARAHRVLELRDGTLREG